MFVTYVIQFICSLYDHSIFSRQTNRPTKWTSLKMHHLLRLFWFSLFGIRKSQNHNRPVNLFIIITIQYVCPNTYDTIRIFQERKTSNYKKDEKTNTFVIICYWRIWFDATAVAAAVLLLLFLLSTDQCLFRVKQRQRDDKY